MAKRLKNSGYRKSYKGQNKELTILADDIYSVSDLESLEREKTYPLVIKGNFDLFKLEFNGNMYYAFSSELAYLDVDRFLLDHRNVSLFLKGVRPIPYIAGREFFCDEEHGTDLLLKTEDECYFESDIISSLTEEYYSKKVLVKNSSMK